MKILKIATYTVSAAFIAWVVFSWAQVAFGDLGAAANSTYNLFAVLF